MEVPKSLISKKKQMERTAKLWQNLIQLIAWPASRLLVAVPRSRAKCQLVQTSYIKRIKLFLFAI